MCKYIYTHIHINSYTYSLFGGLNHRDQLLDPSTLFVPPTKELTIVTDSATQDERVKKNNLFYPIFVIFAVKHQGCFWEVWDKPGFSSEYIGYGLVRIRVINRCTKIQWFIIVAPLKFQFLRTPSFRRTQIDEENDDITSRNVSNFSSWMLGWSNNYSIYWTWLIFRGQLAPKFWAIPRWLRVTMGHSRRRQASVSGREQVMPDDARMRRRD